VGEVFLALAVVLTIIAVIGHLIWVTVAWLIRALVGSSRPRPEDERRQCPFCDRPTPRRFERCDWCGRMLRGALAEELADVAATVRQIARLKRAEVIKPSEADDLASRLRDYRGRLVAPPAPAPQPGQTPRPVEAPCEPILLEPAAPAKPAAPQPGRVPSQAPAASGEAPTAPAKPRPAAVAPVVSKEEVLSALRAQVPAAPGPRKPAPPKPAPPKPPRKSWFELLTAFLEERNIPLAELFLLAAGLLIVGGSVALVVGFWETLERIPLFQFAVFVAATSAFFGAGLYAFHRWKIESTGRALLAFATLLVPLNFLAMASLPHWTLLNLAWEAAAAAIFVGLVGLAAKVLVVEGRWHQVAAVVGCSCLVPLAARVPMDGEHAAAFIGLGLLPVAVFGGAVGAFLYPWRRRSEIDAAGALSLLALLGMAVFALAVALYPLVGREVKAAGVGVTLDRASVVFALAAAPILAVGLGLVRGTAHDPALGAYRTAGTMVALAAAVVMLAALGMAWPQPPTVIAVGTLSAAILAAAAFRYGFPVLHAGAIASITLVYLTAYHVTAGSLAWVPTGDPTRQMLELAVTAQSGLALVWLVTLLGAAAGWLARRERGEHAEQYAGGAAVLALLSVAAVTVHAIVSQGAQSPLAAAVYAIYGAGGLALNVRLRKRLVSYVGLVLLVGASSWTLWWGLRESTLTWSASLYVTYASTWAAIAAGEALAMALVAWLLHRRGDHEPGASWKAPRGHSDRNARIEVFREPLLRVAEWLAPLGLAVAALAAWRDLGLSHQNPIPVVTIVYGAAFYLLLAWGYRSAERTWVGSLVVLAGLIHTLVWNYRGALGLDLPLLDAFLAHATLAVLAGAMLEVWLGRAGARNWSGDVRRVFIEPLGQTALMSSVFAIPVLAFVAWQQAILSLAACLFWLAAIWLVIAWTNRWTAMMAAAQGMLTLAVVAATTAWLARHPWGSATVPEYTDPRSLQVYGIGLGLLTLAWIVARIALRPSATARLLLDPPWPAVDRLVGYAVVVGQLVVVAWYLGAGCRQELVGWPQAAVTREAFGAPAWILVGVLAAGLLVALWHRWKEPELASLCALAATVPCLGAGLFGATQAAASGLRWGSAFVWIVGSLAVWQRGGLDRLVRRIGARIEVGREGPRTARAVLLITTVAPVLALTAWAALAQLGGIRPGGPAAGSLFAEMGPELSYLVPLVLVGGGLVGFALREASAGYAFAAGLVAKMAVTLGYLLVVTTAGRSIGVHEVVMVLQLLTIAAAAWAVAWLIGRRWVDVWREGPRPSSARLLMGLQFAMGVAGNALLWVPAMLSLAFLPADWQRWPIEAGTWVGWLALASVAGAAAYRQIGLGRSLRPSLVGLTGLVALGLVACTIRLMAEAGPLWTGMPIAPEWGYRSLMLAWAMYSLAIVSATWWAASLRTLPGAKGPPQALIRTASVWVTVAGALAVLLGIKVALVHAEADDLLWAALSIALASGAGAAMSVWRRREGWAFAAAPGVNLAASLVVWYWRYEYAFDDWWVLLLQANVIATSAIALVWLGARRRLYALRELSIRDCPLLGVQTALGALGSALLLIPPVVRLVHVPAMLPDWAVQVGQAQGWIAVVLTAAAAAWYLRQVAPGELFHVVGCLGVGLGVLLACTAPTWTLDGLPDTWLEYHVLMTSWAVVGLVALALGILGRNLRIAGQLDPERADDRAGHVLPAGLVEGWVMVIAAVTVAVAVLHCVHDPWSPWWSAGAVLAAGAMAGTLAVWRERPGYVYLSGLSANVAGTVVWIAWGPSTPAGFIHTNALCLGAASCAWSLVGALARRGVPVLTAGDRRWPFPSLAAGAALMLLSIVAVVSVVQNLYGTAHAAPDRLAWLALALGAAAATAGCWDRSVRLPLQGLYGAGLIALAMALDVPGLLPRAYCHAAAPLLGAFVLVAAVSARVLARTAPVWQALQVPLDKDRWSTAWFFQAQAVVGGVAGLLGAWIALDFAFDAIAPWIAWPGSARWAGPLASALLASAAVLMASDASPRWRAAWQHATIGLATLLLTQLGWVLLDPAWFAETGASAWLHRSVAFMVAAVAVTWIAGFAVAPCTRSETGWPAAAKGSVPVLGGLALATLAAILAQEVLLYEAPDGTLMALWAVVIVGAALAGLIAAGLAFAVVPRWDPLGMSDRGRTAYVYAAEALGGLIAMHLRLTLPWLFRLGFFERYWMLLVMAVAFLGAGLSELFRRRRMPVLSEPLERTAVLLPLAPAIGFFLPAETVEPFGLAGHSPAVWFLTGLFYGILAKTRRSPLFGGLSLLAANVGLWVVWHQLGWGFADHPQLWLIPVALVALVAEYLNRDRLSEAWSTGLRYMALSTIYVSSTVEFLFLNKVGESLVLPLVLIALSILGVTAGIALRIRSYVYLGITFLLVVIVTMIKHAAIDRHQTWVFYLFCLALGLGMLAVYGIHEKYRDRVAGVIGDFRRWER